MRTTIDSAGRIVIPKKIRDRVGLQGGDEIEVRERDGRIEIEPLSTPVRLERTDVGVVAVPDDPLPPLTDDVVREAMEQSRR